MLWAREQLTFQDWYHTYYQCWDESLARVLFDNLSWLYVDAGRVRPNDSFSNELYLPNTWWINMHVNVFWENVADMVTGRVLSRAVRGGAIAELLDYVAAHKCQI